MATVAPGTRYRKDRDPLVLKNKPVSTTLVYNEETASGDSSENSKTPKHLKESHDTHATVDNRIDSIVEAVYWYGVHASE